MSEVIIFWALLFWPTIIAITYTLWKSSVLSRQGTFLFLSIVLGYIVPISINILIGLFIKLTGILDNATEIQGKYIMFVIIASLLLSPVISTHVLFIKKFN